MRRALRLRSLRHDRPRTSIRKDDYDAWVREQWPPIGAARPHDSQREKDDAMTAHAPAATHGPRRAPRAQLHPHLHLLDRSQDDRTPVPVPGALHDDHRRPPRAAGALAARLARAEIPRTHWSPSRHVRRPHPPEFYNAAVHHARDDHDLLRRHAAARRLLRELPHPAHDRRPRHGVPAAEHAVVLGRRARGHHHARQLLRARRRRRRRLDLLRAAVRHAEYTGVTGARTCGASASSSSASPPSWARSTTSPPSSTCARRA